MNSSSPDPMVLQNLSDATAKFFMKAPDNNVLEFVMSPKVILVEGDAEYMLLEQLYITANKHKPEKDNVHIISVGGTSFKRYLDIAKLLGLKVAVIRDNDGDKQMHCVENYADYSAENIRIFYDENNENRTFEICMLQSNRAICEELFNGKLRKKPYRDEVTTVEEYMLSNKTEAAFQLLDKKAQDLTAPNYISEALAWINE